MLCRFLQACFGGAPAYFLQGCSCGARNDRRCTWNRKSRRKTVAHTKRLENPIGQGLKDPLQTVREATTAQAAADAKVDAACTDAVTLQVEADRTAAAARQKAEEEAAAAQKAQEDAAAA